MTKQPLLISACLLGVRCRYDGACKACAQASALAQQYQLIPICPEQLGGLPTPRTPAERRGEHVFTKDGRDVTAEYQRGAEEALRLAQLFCCEAAVLKERSPSCGSGTIYDGSFSSTLCEGYGVCAQILLEHGIAVFGESHVAALLK